MSAATGTHPVLLTCVPTLAERGLLPEDVRSVIVGGSMATGWAAPTSDIDLVVVTGERFDADSRVHLTEAPLTPDTLPTTAFQLGERRWEIRYWTDDQIDQLLDKVCWERFGTDRRTGEKLVELEEVFLERLHTSLPLHGEGWLERRRQQVQSSAFRAILLFRALGNADDRVDTAVAQLAAGDPDTAVLAVRDAFGWAMDALLMASGSYGALVKWRARRFKEARPRLLTFDEYWAIETMRDYSPDRAGDWITAVARLCKRVSMEVEI